MLLLAAEEINGHQNVISRENQSAVQSLGQREFAELCAALRTLAESRMLKVEQYTSWESTSEAIPVEDLSAGDLLRPKPTVTGLPCTGIQHGFRCHVR